MNSPELNSALVENIADLEVVSKRLDILAESLDEVVNDITIEWAGAHDWFVECDEEQLRLAPKGEGWYDPDAEDENGAYFKWDFFENQIEDNYFTTQICQLGQDKAGLRFVQKQVKRGQWKKIVSELSEFVAGSGFILEEQNLGFFLPIKVDSKILAAGIADGDIKAGLQQYKKTLDQLLLAKPGFDKILARIK